MHVSNRLPFVNTPSTHMQPKASIIKLLAPETLNGFLAVAQVRGVSSKNHEVCIAIKQLLDKRQLVAIGFSLKAGLQAYVYRVNREGLLVESSDALPLIGMAHQMGSTNDVARLKKYFERVHLIPEKKGHGYCQVRISVSGLGGTKAKIPFQPGLGLGGIIKCDFIDKIEQFVADSTLHEACLNQIASAENEIKELNLKISGAPEGSRLLPIWKNTITLREKRIENLLKKSEQIPEQPLFEGFQQGLESPIDFQKSKVVVLPRAFESLNFNSQYISMSSSFSEISDKLTQVASVNSAKGKIGWDFLGGNVSADLTLAVSNRVTEIKQTDLAEGVLVINAFVSTRNVASFEQVFYDKEKLKMIWNVMQTGSESDWNRYGITIREDKSKAIVLLTEAVLGGAFTGIVTLLKKSEKQREIEKKERELSGGIGAGGGLTTGVWDASLGLSSSNQWSALSEHDRLKEISNNNIQVEILSQGAIPSFASETIKVEVAKHLNLSPSQLKVSQEDDALIDSLSEANQAERDKITKKLRIHMVNAQLVVQNMIRELVSSKEEHSAHSISTVTQAYESFSKQISSDKEGGVPIGFNYRILTEKDIAQQLDISESINIVEKKSKSDEL